MVLAFKTATVTIPQTNGPITINDDVAFPRRIRDKNAEVTLKAFKLDYIGGAREGDIAQAGVSLESVGDEAVEFKVKVNYSAATYTGEVSVLVIADLFDHPVP